MHVFRRAVIAVATVTALLPPPTAAERLPLRIYTTADGLAHDNVIRIVRDSRGFLWFCTADGLSRFDGYSFVSFGVAQGLPHPRVNDFLETRDGGYWIATDGGVTRFDPRGTPRQSSGATAGSPMFTQVAQPDGGLREKAVTVLREAKDGTGSRLSLTVADNGRGFDPSDPVEGQGLASMARRTRRLGGTWEVVSAPGRGTIVKADVSL